MPGVQGANSVKVINVKNSLPANFVWLSISANDLERNVAKHKDGSQFIWSANISCQQKPLLAST